VLALALTIHSLRTGTPIHYLGHNPLGSAMVFSLLSTLGAVFVTGLITLASIEFEGPFLPFVRNLSDAQVYLIQDIHEVLANVMLGLIFFHIVGAVSASIQHKENLILAMFSGRKRKHFNGSIKIKRKYNEK
jgi:cytochrome b